MRAVIQRVRNASVRINGRTYASINAGLAVLVGVAHGDSDQDIAYMADKIANLRILADDTGHMNRSVRDVGGDILLISQFTLIADTRKGRRPSFTGAEAPELASELIGNLACTLANTGINVQTGKFQADMDVELINQGPVTIIIDSQQRHMPRRSA